jgi:HK97 family phage portal protein
MFLARNIGATRGPGDDFWYGPAGATATGAVVTTESAMRHSTVYKCVRVRAETIGMLPLMIYRRLSAGGKEVDSGNPLYSLLHDQPNPWQTAMMWRQMMQSWLDLRGNAYSEVIYGGSGRVDMLVPMHPDCVTVEVLPNGMPRYKYRTQKGEKTLVFGQVLHVSGLSADGYVGMNPIELEREAIGAGVSARDYGARFFANSARTPAWIKMPGKFASPEARRKWVDDFSRAYGGINSGKTPVLEQGMELNGLPSVTNTDAQFLDSRKYSDIDIAGLFRMPPHKIGILDRATWGNIEHQQLDFVTDTIMPSCVAWEQALLRDLDFGESFPEFKLAGLLRGDTRSRFEAYGKGIQDGWLTRNEARSMENMNPIEGLDEPLQPLNMAPAGSKGTDQARGNPISGERRIAVATAAAERVARKEFAALTRAFKAGQPLAAALDKHAEFVAQVMAVKPETAAAYVAETVKKLDADDIDATLEADWIDTQAAALLRLED